MPRGGREAATEEVADPGPQRTSSSSLLLFKPAGPVSLSLVFFLVCLFVSSP